jgi:hypothetical protein
MSGKIVLSYRRSDSDVITGRIRDNLANHYGEDAVFMDIDSIPLGIDYREQMRDALSDNKVCPKACKGFAISMPAYVRPAVISPNARCCMKSVIPAASDNTCCVSGTKIR